MNYDLEYFEKMLRLNSKTGELISNIRWAWIGDTHPKTILDYGSGCGFFRAYRPEGVEVNSYDIGTFPQTGIELKIYDIVCFNNRRNITEIVHIRYGYLRIQLKP